MVVIATLQLILDDHKITVIVLCNQVNTEITRILFPINVAKRQIKCIVEHIDVILKPGSEVICLVPPDVT